MSESARKHFSAHLAHAGWLVVTITGLAFVLPAFFCRDGAGTISGPIGRDMAWYTVFWGGVILLLAGLTTPTTETSLPLSVSARQTVYQRFGGLLGFWLAGVTSAGLVSALGLYLVMNEIWKGFPGLIGGTLFLLMPLTAFATLLHGRTSTVSRGFLLVLLVALGSNLDLIRDALDSAGNVWLKTGFEVLALFIPDLSFPDWRGWLVFGHEPGTAALFAALVASAGLTLFFLEVRVFLGVRGCAGQVVPPAEDTPTAG